jgi:hypothetical protein
MNLKTKAVIYNFLGFAPIFLVSYFLLETFVQPGRPWTAIIAAVITFILAPKFQIVKTQDKDRLFMKWIFSKEIRELS